VPKIIINLTSEIHRKVEHRTKISLVSITTLTSEIHRKVEHRTKNSLVNITTLLCTHNSISFFCNWYKQQFQSYFSSSTDGTLNSLAPFWSLVHPTKRTNEFKLRILSKERIKFKVKRETFQC